VDGLDWGWLADVPYVGGALALIGGVVAFVRKALPLIRRIGHFVDDWFGEDGRAGAARTPGVLDRLKAIEGRLSAVEGQFTTNGGSTMRDAVNRVEQTVKEIQQQEGSS
jgi:hypothetical protein